MRRGLNDHGSRLPLGGLNDHGSRLPLGGLNDHGSRLPLGGLNDHGPRLPLGGLNDDRALPWRALRARNPTGLGLGHRGKGQEGEEGAERRVSGGHVAFDDGTRPIFVKMCKFAPRSRRAVGSGWKCAQPTYSRSSAASDLGTVRRASIVRAPVSNITARSVPSTSSKSAFAASTPPSMYA